MWPQGCGGPGAARTSGGWGANGGPVLGGPRPGRRPAGPTPRPRPKPFSYGPAIISRAPLPGWPGPRARSFFCPPCPPRLPKTENPAFFGAQLAGRRKSGCALGPGPSKAGQFKVGLKIWGLNLNIIIQLITLIIIIITIFIMLIL